MASRQVLGRLLGTLTSLIVAAAAIGAETPIAKLMVDVDKPGITVSPVLYGIFFEEINRAGDGGLYAEMIQNRSFEDARAQVNWKKGDGESMIAEPLPDFNVPLGWSLVKGGSASETMELDNKQPLNADSPTS